MFPQVICNADLVFINVIAKWPGSVHDARILRESMVFEAFERNQKPLQGLISGDSGYMLRDWLMTPVLHPQTRSEQRYNFSHSSTRTTVERAIGVAKRRWHCLRCGLRVDPAKACKIITVCLMLHNRATLLNLAPPHCDDAADDDDGDDFHDDSADQNVPPERAGHAAGKAVRDRIINLF